mmetsp:Transcript_2569/g.6692  ORF Transcript_2569/g.6692 Transcript_2569/m.6692 type:complete len:250 (-) Transcript_2569:752-1501(-)
MMDPVLLLRNLFLSGCISISSTDSTLESSASASTSIAPAATSMASTVPRPIPLSLSRVPRLAVDLLSRRRVAGGPPSAAGGVSSPGKFDTTVICCIPIPLCRINARVLDCSGSVGDALLSADCSVASLSKLSPWSTSLNVVFESPQQAPSSFSVIAMDDLVFFGAAIPKKEDNHLPHPAGRTTSLSFPVAPSSIFFVAFDFKGNSCSASMDASLVSSSSLMTGSAFRSCAQRLAKFRRERNNSMPPAFF